MEGLGIESDYGENLGDQRQRFFGHIRKNPFVGFVELLHWVLRNRPRWRIFDGSNDDFQLALRIGTFLIANKSDDLKKRKSSLSSTTGQAPSPSTAAVKFPTISLSPTRGSFSISCLRKGNLQRGTGCGVNQRGKIASGFDEMYVVVIG